MRVEASTIVVMVLLAGCAGSDETPSAPTENPATPSAPTNETAAPAPRFSDTLHLGTPPAVSLVAGNGTEVKQSPVTFRGGLEANEGATWRYTFANQSQLQAYEARLWIKVTETLFVPPQNSSCVWSLSVTIQAGTGAPSRYPIVCLVRAAGTISAGTYELRFDGPAPSSPPSAAPGAVATINLRRAAFSPSTNDAVFVLSGTAETDSRVAVTGLREQLPPEPA